MAPLPLAVKNAVYEEPEAMTPSLQFELSLQSSSDKPTH